MRAQVAKWGNSLALRIPGAFARQIGVEDGRPVDIVVTDGKLVVTPVASQPSYEIRNLSWTERGATFACKAGDVVLADVRARLKSVPGIA